MKFLFVFLLVGIYSFSNAQEKPFLRVDVRQNLLTRKIDVLDGPKRLRKSELITLLQSDPEALARYEKALAKQNVNDALSLVDMGLFLGTSVLAVAPRQQSSSLSRLAWPLMIGGFVVGIVSGVYRREARNLTREAIDLYNFGGGTSDPVYFEENRIDQPIFSFKIPIQ
uniref:hypothetical protein n=1 Tax=Algoriphagus sp. TaxID=1872435 RepID=UPI00258C8848|nr:hypothetical protein [Algoriphagus sp.]